MGPMKVVGNAQVFVVVHDMQTGMDIGMRFEVSGSNLEIFNNPAAGSFALTGDMVSREIVDLEYYNRTINKGKALE